MAIAHTEALQTIVSISSDRIFPFRYNYVLYGKSVCKTIDHNSIMHISITFILFSSNLLLLTTAQNIQFRPIVRPRPHEEEEPDPQEGHPGQPPNGDGPSSGSVLYGPGYSTSSGANHGTPTTTVTNVCAGNVGAALGIDSCLSSAGAYAYSSSSSSSSGIASVSVDAAQITGVGLGVVGAAAVGWGAMML